MPRERIVSASLHQMLNSVINLINDDKIMTNQFQFETLFLNIFYCFYFTKYLSPYYSWGDNFIRVLKKNIRKKWSKHLPNIDFFIKQIEIKNKEIDPFEYWFHSEDYFQKIMLLKEIAPLFPVKKKKKKKKRTYIKKYKPIR